jgi:hypothetical protein
MGTRHVIPDLVRLSLRKPGPDLSYHAALWPAYYAFVDAARRSQGAKPILDAPRSSESVRFAICNKGEVPLYNFSDAGDRIAFVRRKNMKLNAQDLKEISALTLEHLKPRVT